MPELPEVETIKLGLQKYVVGHTIENIEIHLAKQFHGDPQLLIGATITGVRRLGKGLLIDCSNGYSLAVHVKMTGQLLYRSVSGAYDGDLPDAYTHVVFHLDNGAVLYYRDMRQFGWVKVVQTEKALALPFFKSLGKEPLSDLTLLNFTQLLKGSKTAIKVLIMDQHKIAGIGNIYANDALYLAGIHPRRPASSLSTEEAKKLFTAIETVLKKGIEVGGASEWHYVDVLGEKGQYQNFFQVYRKDGQACKKCGTIIERIKLGGRGTFFCPQCQI